MKSEDDLFTVNPVLNDQDPVSINITPVAYFLIDVSGKILQVNIDIGSCIHIQPREITGTSLYSFSGNDWLKKICDNLKPGDTVKVTHTLHLSQTSETGKSYFLILRTGSVSEEDHILIVCQPLFTGRISPIHSALDADNLRLIAENAGDAISLHAMDGKIIYMSPSVYKIHGYTAEELLSLGELYTVHPDDKQIISDLLHLLVESRQTVKIQYRFIHKNGSIVWVESANQVITDENDQPLMISVITRDITLSKQLEDNLRKSEERYRTLVKNIPTGLLLMNTKGEVLEVNQALLDVLGSPGEEPTKMINLFEFENLVVSGISGDLKKCVNEKKIIRGQTEYLSKWGKRSVLMYNAIPLFDLNGDVYQVICNVLDITRIKRAEEKSQQQIDFLNVVINTMQEPFFVKDENHRWFMLNDAAIEMMGKPREELIGKSDYDLYPKEQADIFWEKDAYVFENGSNVNEEVISWSDGSEREIITYKRLYTEGSTGKKYIVGTIHDITGIKKSEYKVLETERKYHELFDNANDFIFTTDLNGTFTNANKAMLDMIGIDLSEISNYNIYSFCKPEILEDAKKITSQLMSTGTAPTFEIETIEKDGRSYVLEIQAKIIFQGDQPQGIQAIARDISDKKISSLKLEKLNTELQETNASRDKFYSIIAHDLKNPFNSLIGFADLLLEDFDNLGKDEIRQYVGIIRNTAKNTLILLENLLAWSRLQTGRMVYNPVKLILANEVDAAVTVLFSLSFRKHIEVENLIEKEIIVKADQNMLISVLHNLLMNAIKFTPSNGKITINAGFPEETEGKENEYVIVSVKDTGIGISQEDQKKLFSVTRPFTRQGTEKESGTGLGLLLTREMVEKHGGSLMIESEPGKGSTFSFMIPLFVP